jgi:hypothetical protein
MKKPNPQGRCGIPNEALELPPRRGKGNSILYYLLLLELKKPVKGYICGQKSIALVVHPYNRQPDCMCFLSSQ